MSEELTDLDKEKAKIEDQARKSHSVTIELSCPVKFNSIEQTSITLRRMTVGDQIEFNKEDDTAEATVELIAKLAGVAAVEVRSMDAADMQVCEAAIAGFLRGRPSRGK